MKINRVSNRDSSFRFVDPPLGIAFFFIMIAMMLSLLPVAKENPEQPKAEVPGNLMVTIEWPPDYPQDIDLWVEGPDREPVGYSHQESRIFSYLRDDLGQNTYYNINYELALAQNLVEGEYIINLHFYGIHGGEENVPVSVTVLLYSPGNVSVVFKGKVILGKMGDELTVVRFRLDEKNNLIPGTINNKFIPVRNKKEFEAGFR